MLERIRNGDRNALLDFVKVDKSILTTDLVQTFVCRAQLAADQEFFKQLSNAVAFDPRALRSGNIKLYYLLLNLSAMAVRKLTIKEICNILEEITGTSIDDVDIVRRFWNRHGLHRDPRPK